MIIDFIIIIAIGIFAGKGFWKGFFSESFTFAGYFLALFLTINLYKTVGAHVADLFGFNVTLSQVIAFVVLFLLVTFAAALAGQVATKALKALKLSGLNRGFGALFGAVKGALLAGVFLAILSEKPLFPPLTAALAQSVLTPSLVEGARRVLALIDL